MDQMKMNRSSRRESPVVTGRTDRWLGQKLIAGRHLKHSRGKHWGKQDTIFLGTCDLSTCEGPVTLISSSTPAFSNMLSIASISWMTSNLPAGFLTEQKEVHHYFV